ncbi:Neural cell adhesion molecule 2 like protein [Argiope bruennichi]|uniref:Neural cell adhesion molecule 2 like protein n=1 Tax=Argiope bruennichi TaxID=94029 RepID=A0A8T0ELT3_ARGBR|nr:Neural cell adhesion molecule 2 like protein [Argiope bruennichi]
MYQMSSSRMDQGQDNIDQVFVILSSATASTFSKILTKNYDILISQSSSIELLGNLILAFDSKQGKGRPTPSLKWWKGSTLLDDSSTTLGRGLVKNELVLINLQREDLLATLTCVASNTNLTVPVSKSVTIDLSFPPQLSLALGASQQYEHIREGSDVYFDCNIQANPPVTSVSWKLHSRPLEHQPAAGIIIRNHSLLLQSVGRRHRGKYQCLATNTEGEGVSEEAELMVQFSPVCISGQKRAYAVAKHEEVNVTCEVDADPDDIQFRWMFNNTSETIDIITFTSSATQSIASYVPRSKMDYGTLSCWGRNSIGVQRQPCIFSIVPAGPPDPLQNCTLVSFSSTTFVVNCTQGVDDGGMKPKFHLIAVSMRDSKDIKNISLVNDEPEFLVRGLNPGTTYELVMYASNAKGRSTTIELLATTLYRAERRTGDEPPIAISAVLAVLMGLVGALVLLAIIIIFIMKSRSSSDNSVEQGENNEKMQTPKLKHFEDDSPDVIPSKPFCTDYSSLPPNSNSEIIYENVSQKEHTYANIMNRVHFVPSEPYDDITYAELALPDSQQPFVRHRLEPPTEYADIDFQNSRGTFPATTTVIGNEEDTARSPLVISSKAIRVIPEDCQPGMGAV